MSFGRVRVFDSPLCCPMCNAIGFLGLVGLFVVLPSWRVSVPNPPFLPVTNSWFVFLGNWNSMGGARVLSPGRVRVPVPPWPTITRFLFWPLLVVRVRADSVWMVMGLPSLVVLNSYLIP